MRGSLRLFTGKSTEGPVSLWVQLMLGEGEISAEHLTCHEGTPQLEKHSARDGQQWTRAEPLNTESKWTFGVMHVLGKLSAYINSVCH